MKYMKAGQLPRWLYLNKKEFFSNHARNIQLVKETEAYKSIFVIDDIRLIRALNELGIHVIYVEPCVDNHDDLLGYKNCVIERSGLDWYNQVLAEDMRVILIWVYFEPASAGFYIAS